MSDLVDGSALPLVTVLLPGVGPVDGVLQARRLTPDGWIYDVVVPVPARAVRPVPGADYTKVSTLRQPVSDPVWVTAPLGRDADVIEVHRGDQCWLPKIRKGTVITRDQARATVDQGARVCTLCKPEP